MFLHWRSIANAQWFGCHLPFISTDMSRVSNDKREIVLRSDTSSAYLNPHVSTIFVGLRRSICPANCAGRGTCDFSLTPPQCECFDRSDSSQFCTSSPWSFAPTISPAPTISTSPSAAPSISSSPTAEKSSAGGRAGYSCSFGWTLVALLLFTRM